MLKGRKVRVQTRSRGVLFRGAMCCCGCVLLRLLWRCAAWVRALFKKRPAVRRVGPPPFLLLSSDDWPRYTTLTASRRAGCGPERAMPVVALLCTVDTWEHVRRITGLAGPPHGFAFVTVDDAFIAVATDPLDLAVPQTPSFEEDAYLAECTCALQRHAVATLCDAVALFRQTSAGGSRLLHHEMRQVGKVIECVVNSKEPRMCLSDLKAKLPRQYSSQKSPREERQLEQELVGTLVHALCTDFIYESAHNTYSFTHPENVLLWGTTRHHFSESGLCQLDRLECIPHSVHKLGESHYMLVLHLPGDLTQLKHSLAHSVLAVEAELERGAECGLGFSAHASVRLAVDLSTLVHEKSKVLACELVPATADGTLRVSFHLASSLGSGSAFLTGCKKTL
eukprot:TRINITY_DN580_c0_g1_i1.p1 TRINITY_DN580_c0_g1~~TRINITY_DN580_c0_g1_i1.p1  ORF type:complete len:395 (+),score=44.42 TRINITY_DN580_c0_g1_i1:1660-2844(+)